jgi:hypothetical protein
MCWFFSVLNVSRASSGLRALQEMHMHAQALRKRNEDPRVPAECTLACHLLVQGATASHNQMFMCALIT